MYSMIAQPSYSCWPGQFLQVSSIVDHSMLAWSVCSVIAYPSHAGLQMSSNIDHTMLAWVRVFSDCSAYIYIHAGLQVSSIIDHSTLAWSVCLAIAQPSHAGLANSSKLSWVSVIYH